MICDNKWPSGEVASIIVQLSQIESTDIEYFLAWSDYECWRLVLFNCENGDSENARNTSCVTAGKWRFFLVAKQDRVVLICHSAGNAGIVIGNNIVGVSAAKWGMWNQSNKTTALFMNSTLRFELCFNFFSLRVWFRSRFLRVALESRFIKCFLSSVSYLIRNVGSYHCIQPKNWETTHGIICFGYQYAHSDVILSKPWFAQIV